MIKYQVSEVKEWQTAFFCVLKINDFHTATPTYNIHEIVISMLDGCMQSEILERLHSRQKLVGRPRKARVNRSSAFNRLKLRRDTTVEGIPINCFTSSTFGLKFH